MEAILKYLPRTDEIVKDYEEHLQGKFKREVVVDLYRESIERVREALRNGYYKEKPIFKKEDLEIITEVKEEEIREFFKGEVKKNFQYYLNKIQKLELKTVVNGLGTILHTNLGRAVLSKRAQEAVATVAKGYSNVEYNIYKGSRGNRTSHIEDMIKKLTGAEDALVVNNNAAAIMLVLNSLCKGKECIISRGEMVEIGGSFRIPDVMNFSGSKLVEVGTTNRTHVYDYENAINDKTAAILKVHKSNYDIIGFQSEVKTEVLMEIGVEFKIPVIEDLGSGTLVDMDILNVKEPTVQEEIKKGIDVLTFSGDKLLGALQGGIIVGKKKYLNKIRKNQLLRALRIDKFTIAALEATLIEYVINKEKENIPTLNMIFEKEENIKTSAEDLKRELKKLNLPIEVDVIRETSLVGGGAMPRAVLDTYAVRVQSSLLNEVLLEERLRLYRIPILTRIKDKAILIDVRTLFSGDSQIIKEAIDEIHRNL